MTSTSVQAQTVACTGAGWEVQNNADLCSSTYCDVINEAQNLSPVKCEPEFVLECQIFCESIDNVGVQTKCRCEVSTEGYFLGGTVIFVLLLIMASLCRCCCFRRQYPQVLYHTLPGGLPGDPGPVNSSSGYIANVN